MNSGQYTEALMLLIFAGALLGFLVYNSNPASIFMGDCGSMFVGFFLASSALINVSGGRSRSLSAGAGSADPRSLHSDLRHDFVTVLRKLSGRAASQGGRDHTSHRLVALGMSERHAVWMLYGFAALSGLLAILVQRARLDVSLAAIAGFTIVLTLVGVYLAGVKVYDESDEEMALKDKPLYAFLVDRFLQAPHLRSVAGCGADHSVVLGVVRDQLSARQPGLEAVYSHVAGARVREDGGVSGDGRLSRTLALHEHERSDRVCESCDSEFGRAVCC